jgi:hypothetical protein
VVLSLLLLGVGFFPNVVFCVGDDGHQAVELASLACCHPGVSRGSDCTGSEHCASRCKDVQLTAEAMLSKAGDDDVAADGIAKTPATFISTVTPSMSLSEAISFQIRAAAFHSPTPRERHTTVQLC